MKKALLLFVFLFLAAAVPVNAEDSSADPRDKAYWDIFALDHKDFKDQMTTLKFWRRMEKIYCGYYDEKNQFTAPKEDLEKGYTVFMKSYSEDVYPNTLPSTSNLRKEVALFGTPGEFEPSVICILPYEDLKQMSVSVTDLTGQGGTIYSKDIAIHHIKYEYGPIGIQWYVRGRYLVKGPADGLAKVPRPFWLTVKIPENAVPGIYKGEITVSAGKTPTKLPVTLEVFPFKFAEWGEHNVYWMWYYNGYPENSILERDMANLRAHGMNCFDSANPFNPKVVGGKVSIDFSLAERVIPLLKKHGFNSWMFDNKVQHEILVQVGGSAWSEKHKAALKDFSEQVAAKAKAEKWPKLIFTFDEPREDEDASNIRGYIDMKNTFEIMNAAGLITNPSWSGWGGGKRKDDSSKIADYTELCGLPFYNTTHANFPPAQKIIDKVNALKRPLLLYNCGANRFAFGLLTWQNNALGNSQFWWGAAKYGNPTTEYAASACAVQSKDGIVDTTNWEQIREGVDDYRYIMTLEKAIADCPKPASVEVAAAKALLVSMKTFKVASGKGTGLEADFMAEAMKNFKGDKLDEYRYKMAKSIAAIQAIK
ncbi:MAG: hypothetical protein WCI43_06690 [Candidatus Firestonebacteria bacterium]